jgi:hypothetical protein
MRPWVTACLLWLILKFPLEDVSRSPWGRGDLMTLKEQARKYLKIVPLVPGKTKFHEFVRRIVINELDDLIRNVDVLLQVGFVTAVPADAPEWTVNASHPNSHGPDVPGDDADFWEKL